MATSWVDVQPSNWFYNEIMEASRLDLEDGRPFIAGVPYNVYMTGSPYIMEEFTAGSAQVEFTLKSTTTPTPANPLYVYIDGVQSMYKSVSSGTTGTTVILYTPPGNGKTVTITSYGKPLVDAFGKPSLNGITRYPTVALSAGSDYVYDPSNRKYQETAYAYGTQLKKVHITEEEWKSTGLTNHEIAQKYIGYSSDKYMITPSGVAMFPYNMNGSTVTITYLENSVGYPKPKTEKLKVVSTNIAHNDRFFPGAYITRAEAFSLIDRLRQTFYSRFTDVEAPTNILNDVQYSYLSQRVFRINGYYPVGTGKLEVYRNDKKLSTSEYSEEDNHTIILNIPCEDNEKLQFKYSKTTSSRFYDIGNDVIYNTPSGTVNVGGTADVWWVQNVLAMEDETFNSGEYLINGIAVSASGNTVSTDAMNNPTGTTNDAWFMGQTCLTRAEAVAFLNRFRKWVVERLK